MMRAVRAIVLLLGAGCVAAGCEAPPGRRGDPADAEVGAEPNRRGLEIVRARGRARAATAANRETSAWWRCIESQLLWLASAQCADGGWTDSGEPVEAADGAGGRVFATACALIAFAANGHSPTQGRHRDVVDRGAAWLAAQQGPAGAWVDGDSTSASLVQAIGTLALVEAAEGGRNAIAARAASRAVDALLAMRDENGRWGRSGGSGDAEQVCVSTGWALVALDAAQRCGAGDVSAAAFAGAALLGGRCASAAVLAGTLAPDPGAGMDDAQLEDAIERLHDRIDRDLDLRRPAASTLAWLAAYHAGGRCWQRAVTERDAWVRQVVAGPGYWSVADEGGPGAAGRVANTGLVATALAVGYRDFGVIW